MSANTRWGRIARPTTPARRGDTLSKPSQRIAAEGRGSRLQCDQGGGTVGALTCEASAGILKTGPLIQRRNKCRTERSRDIGEQVVLSREKPSQLPGCALFRSMKNTETKTARLMEKVRQQIRRFRREGNAELRKVWEARLRLVQRLGAASLAMQGA